MRKLLIYLKGYKKECILAPLFKMLEASFELMVPLVVANIIDVGIKNQDARYVIRMCMLLIFLAVIGLIASITAQFFAAKAAIGFGTGVRKALFRHLLSFSFTEIDTLGVSTMITRMTSDINQAQNGVNMVLRLFLRSPFVVIGAAVMAFTINPEMAILFVGVIAILSIVIFGIMLINIPMLKKVQRRLEEVLGLTRENLKGVRVIRAFCKEKEEETLFNEKNNLLTKYQKKAGAIAALLNPLTYVLINIGIISVIWTGAIKVDTGVLETGELVALYNYMSQILVELIKLAALIITVNKGVACGNRVSEVFQMESSEIQQIGQSLEDEIQEIDFKDVSLTYKGASEPSLEHISFKAKRGQIIGIIGGTGSGKSSLAHLIAKFYTATQGRVLVNGVDINTYKIEDIRSKVAVVMQKAILFNGSIEDNLRWGKQDATVEELRKATSDAQFEDTLLNKGGFGAHIEQGGSNLSGGQKQRLSIARALVKKPDVLILDDSTSALDFKTDAAVRHALCHLDKSPITFMISERASSIRTADLIIVLDDGIMVGKGTHESLLKECETYQEIYYSQLNREEKA